VVTDICEDETLYAEDLVSDIEKVQSLGSYAISEESIRGFAMQWDPLPIHIGDGGHFNRVVASGLQTFAVYHRLAVKSVIRYWAVVAGRSVRDLNFYRPVFPGDVLTGFLTVNAVTPKGDERAQVTLTGRLDNQCQKLVLSVTNETYVKNRAN